MRVFVGGGTGRLGSEVVDHLIAHGHEAVVAAPSTGVDLITGAGLAGALDGAEAVIDVANSPSFEDQAVLEFFTTATGNLLRAEAEAGVGHHLLVSIVGADRAARSGYLRAEVAQEEIVREGPIPWSIVEATQFFEFVEAIVDSGTADGVVRYPSAPLQPIAVSELSGIVSEIATGAPLRQVVETGGPERIGLADLSQRWIDFTGDDRSVLVDDSVPYFGAVLAEDTLTTGPGARLGSITFDDWLAQRRD